jgi:hypothetical protein
MKGRVRFANDRYRVRVTDEHEAAAEKELSRVQHSRFGRLFLRAIGWPVSGKPNYKPPRTRPSHEGAVRREGR